MPGVAQQSVDQIVEECREVESLGIPGVILVWHPGKEGRARHQAYAADGVVQRAIEAIRKSQPEICW